MTKNLTCIACPRGCALTVNFEKSGDSVNQENIEVKGNSCPKGLAYGRQEVICPMRTLTTTVEFDEKSLEKGKKDSDSFLRRLPVKTGSEIPLSEMIEMMNSIRKMTVSKPVHYGDNVGCVHTADGKDIAIIACATSE